MKVFIEIAFRNLLQARRRTTLLALGLAFVTFMLVTLLGLSGSVADQLLRAATTLSSGHVNIAGFTKAKPTDAAAYISNITELKQLVRENVKDVDFIIDRARGWTLISSETDSLQSGMSGIDIKEEGRLVELLSLAEEVEYKDKGRAEILGNVLDIGQDDTAILFVGQAKQLNVTVGDNITVVTQRPDGLTDTKDLRVVAVARDISFLSNWTVFIPKKSLKELYGLKGDTSGAVEIFLKDPKRAEEVMAQLRKLLPEKGFGIMEYNSQPFWMKFETVAGEDWIGQKLDVTYWKDEISFIVWILTVVNAVSVLLVGILLVIIGVGITNTMWIAVRERTNEIGTLRAIGMSKRRVLLMFLLEAAMLGILGTVAGGLLGQFVATLVDAVGVPLPPGPLRAFLMTDKLRLTVSFAQVAMSAVSITIVTVLAASWPAVRASRLQPVTAISNVG